MKKNLCLSLVLILCVLSLCSCDADKKAETAYEHRCTFLIECKSVLDNMESLNKEKAGIIPENGIILEETDVGFNENDTVYDVLIRILKENKIQFDADESAYIKGISNLYSGDCGEYSGWLFYVNGESATVGADSLKLSENDEVHWKFTCDFMSEF